LPRWPMPTRRPRPTATSLNNRLGFANTRRNPTTIVSFVFCPVSISQHLDADRPNKAPVCLWRTSTRSACPPTRSGRSDAGQEQVVLGRRLRHTGPRENRHRGCLGVDFGVVNLAFDSQERSYTGADVEKVRSRFALKRATVQADAAPPPRGNRAPRAQRLLTDIARTPAIMPL
jgi:hypothetical protein